MPRKAIALVLAAIPFLLFMSAEEGAGPSAGLDFAGKVVNFMILFGGLAFVTRKPLAAMLSKRAEDIRNSLRDAEASKNEALERLADAEGRLAGIEDEVVRMLDIARDLAAKEKARIALQAEAESLRIRKVGEQLIDEHVRAGLRELRAYAAEQATSLARERIQKRLTPADHSGLIDKSIGRLSELHEKSGSR